MTKERRKKTNRIVWRCLLVALAVILVVWFHSSYIARTRIVFINEQPVTLQSISQANNNKKIKLYELGVDELGKLRRYDVALVNGMGLRLTAEQREHLKKAAAKGMPIYTSMATDPDNNINTLNKEERELVVKYMSAPSKRNYRSLLNFLRRNVDGKLTSAGEINAPEEQPGDYLYFPEGDDEQVFLSVAEYETFMREHNIYHEGAPRVVVTGVVTDLSDLVLALSEHGYNVYPVASMFRLMNYVDEIHPDVVVNAAHGRMGDHVVKYLQDNNVLFFDPVYVNATVQQWESDPLGMAGGFLSQSIVMPELDGAIRTSALFALDKDKDGLLKPYAVPDRLAEYVQTIDNYLQLRRKRNADKRIAVIYYKGPGQGNLVASGMDVAPSLYNMLSTLRQQGYNVDGLPASVAAFREQLQHEGSLFNAFAEGNAGQFMKEGNPQLVNESDYYEWCRKAMPDSLLQSVTNTFGTFPGDHNRLRTSDGQLAFPRIKYGNIVLVPQPLAGEGTDEFRIVHGTNQAPPHSYVAPYLWIRYAFNADALIHFGTHGSLEFTQGKQVALSSGDWPDRLVGTLPHFYLYTIDNVGEAMTARRRSYAGLQSYLTPPFHESELRNQYKALDDKINQYTDSKAADKTALSLEIKRMAVKLGLSADLGLDTVVAKPYTEDDIERLSDYKEELATEKITDRPYVLGIPYRADDVKTSVLAMTVDPVAYNLYALDRLMGRAADGLDARKSHFDAIYTRRAEALVSMLLSHNDGLNDKALCNVMQIDEATLAKCRDITAQKNAPKGMMAMMMKMSNVSTNDSAQTKPRSMTAMSQDTVPNAVPKARRSPMAKLMRRQARKMIGSGDASSMLDMAKRMGADEESLKKMAEAIGAGDNGKPKTVNAEIAAADSAAEVQRAFDAELAAAVDEIETALGNVQRYAKLLKESPSNELQSLLNALDGGYTAPSPGGDPIVNPNTLPTGRNLFAINAEETPTESAWKRGKELADNTIENYRKSHGGEYPRKVAYTLWSGEFVQTGGATIAQVLYMLGVEPVRDRYGRVTDLRLIPSADLGRPRIDVVVQTSGQLRDLAASRLFLISRAVAMASEADDEQDNMVRAGVEESERALINRGVSPRDARRMSRYRVFGGQNGGYGSGIQGMVEKGDAWDEQSQLASVFLNNMGGYYGDNEGWMDDMHEAFEAALTRTDVVVQPRQNNTWGALSLDHVYEFMGGLNMAVREVTGKDPEAVFSDYRNRNHYRMQNSREAIATEARTKLFNKTYIQNAFDAGATPTDDIAEMVRNMYGWNVMKPDVVGDRMWNELYDVYIDDKYSLGTEQQFADVNPVAMMEMTATMMETARKGMWHASDEQLGQLARIYTDFVERFGPSGSAFDGDNAKLQQFVAQHVDEAASRQYLAQMRQQRTSADEASSQASVLEKQTVGSDAESEGFAMGGMVAVLVALALFAVLVILISRRRKA